MEYFFGTGCVFRNKQFVMHSHHKGKDLVGTSVVRSRWDGLPVPRCLRITATGPHADMIRFRPYSFAVCYRVLLLTLTRGLNYEYYYYDWYIPAEMTADLDWDLYYYHV
ncbi:hypothetical protein HW555_002686 [Spodoptera exigua]|uniref:Uncharacterized protein n=1 Tax=Spodoptera exigua TaxID=7107 RepID=A0A835GQA1_SPOEX|nr:hypothetical protein HW555_002686 [Spodoptera exigua]